MRAAADPATVVPENKTGNNLALADSNSQASSTAGTGSDGGVAEKSAIPNTSQTPTSNDDTQAQISAPLVFNAKELARMRAEAAAPAVSEQVAAMPLSARPADPLPPLLVLPPAPKPEHKGFFGRIGRFFRAIF
jgi:hypothetical protein